MQKYGVIYKITNNINGKLYIGQTINFDRRLREHKLAKDNYPIHTAIRKYGWGNFTMEVIDEAYDRDELNKKETYWVAYYNSTNTGYNLRTGGAEDMVGENNPFYGHSFDEETKQHIYSELRAWQLANPSEYALAQSRCGEKNGSYGKKFSEDRKRHIGKPGQHRNTKGYKIKCVETDEEFASILKASEKYGHRRIIKHCCEDNTVTLFGLHFKYLDI